MRVQHDATGALLLLLLLLMMMMIFLFVSRLAG